MTPKEKAEELFWNYTKVHNFSAILDFDGNTHIDLEYGISKVKQCALIAVDEAIEFENRIIKEVQFLSDKTGHAFRCEGLYWEEVKHEIEKL
jgi:thymidine kinase